MVRCPRVVDRDWGKLQHEYATTNITVRELCSKYDINMSTVTKRMKKEGWKKTRSEVKVVRKDATRVIKAHADISNAELCARIGSAMMKKTMEAIEQIDPKNTQGLKHLSGVVKDLKEVRLWKDDLDLDRKEQEARIAKLQREAEGEADNSITINLVGADDYVG